MEGLSLIRCNMESHMLQNCNDKLYSIPPSPYLPHRQVPAPEVMYAEVTAGVKVTRSNRVWTLSLYRVGGGGGEGWG